MEGIPSSSLRKSRESFPSPERAAGDLFPLRIEEHDVVNIKQVTVTGQLLPADGLGILRDQGSHQLTVVYIPAVLPLLRAR